MCWGGGPSRGVRQGALAQNLEQEDHLHRLQGERRPLKLCNVSPSSNTVLDLGWGMVGNARVGQREDPEEQKCSWRKYMAQQAKPHQTGPSPQPPPSSWVVLVHQLPSQSFFPPRHSFSIKHVDV